MTVLILTSEDDITADLVVRHLPQDQTLRVDPAGLPGRVDLTARVTAGGEVTGRISVGNRSTALEDITAVWWRRPGTPGAGADVQREFVGMECERAFYGALRALPAVRWMNHPDAIERSRYKVWQLRTAAAAGLRVPETLFTTEPAAAEDYAAERAPLIVKSVSGRHPEDPPLTLATSRVESGADFADVAACVTCLQPEIDKRGDVRLTVVGDDMFACLIEPCEPTLDWRFLPAADCRWTLIPIPDRIRGSVAAYMRHAGLAYAALDFAVTANTWWYLEANASGQFGFVELTTGARISQAIAAWLTSTIT